MRRGGIGALLHHRLDFQHRSHPSIFPLIHPKMKILTIPMIAILAT
jgi:hypothetical protein